MQGRWLAVWLLLALAAPAHASSDQVKRPPCGIPTNDSQVFDGMYSIFLDVTRDVWRMEQRPLPRGGRTVNLVDAVDAVRCDGNAARKRNRQRYVVTKLAAGAILLARGHNEPAAKKYEKALDDLGVHRVLLQQLEHSPAQTLLTLEGDAGKIIDAEKKLCAFQRSCCSCITECKVGKDGGTSSVSFLLRVPREPKDVFCVVDPQTWPTVSPGYFKNVFVTDAPVCSTPDPQCRTRTSPCPPGSPPGMHPKPPPAGSQWCGLVEEQFETQVANTTAKLANRLKVRMDFTPDDTSTPGDDETATRMRYGLCEAISYEVGGSSKQCGLELDCGEASIAATGAGGSRFFGIKSIRFENDLPEDPNGWAVIALEVLADEAATASCLIACGEGESAPAVDPCVDERAKCTCPGPDACEQVIPYKPPATDYCP